jgi:hypothetical protein
VVKVARAIGAAAAVATILTGHRVDPDLAEKLVDFVLVRQIPKKAAARR